MYTRSPAALEALSSFKILQLPSAATLKSYVHSNKEDHGQCSDRLKEERSLYNARVQAHIQAGKPCPPLSEGCLIVDEVKVVAKLHWNSRDDSLVGHSMTADEMATLQDLYLVLGNDPSTEKTDYVLQTLWRDHSSHCDIVGPYYTSTGPFKAKFTAACVFDALRHFHSFDFRVTLLILDGASSNLSMLKLLLGVRGVFGHRETGDDCHKVTASFLNPFSGDKVFLMICPSHQVCYRKQYTR